MNLLNLFFNDSHDVRRALLVVLSQHCQHAYLWPAVHLEVIKGRLVISDFGHFELQTMSALPWFQNSSPRQVEGTVT